MSFISPSPLEEVIHWYALTAKNDTHSTSDLRARNDKHMTPHACLLLYDFGTPSVGTAYALSESVKSVAGFSVFLNKFFV
jgi:hypothetical protein